MSLDSGARPAFSSQVPCSPVVGSDLPPTCQVAAMVFTSCRDGVERTEGHDVGPKGTMQGRGLRTAPGSECVLGKRPR